MLKRIELNNVGPAPELAIDFGERLNLLTGDNGLGKSFLLDVGWWAMTRSWPAEVNPGITAGMPALPAAPGEATIKSSYASVTKTARYESSFRPEVQAWTWPRGRPGSAGLVLYAMVDGSFAVWDPVRNYGQNPPGTEGYGDADGLAKRPPAYVFGPTEVWHGREDRGTWLCNGLVRDWAMWQRENGEAFRLLKQLLATLTPPGNGPLVPGELTRINIDDQRDMPTIRMAYGHEVPVVHASSAIRRVIALAYLLIWAWEEHKRAAKLLQRDQTNRIVFLVDEIDAHLHPSWQRTIVRTLLSAVHGLSGTATVQLLATTHSPLVMASVEPIFDAATDAWFDLDLEDAIVRLHARDFERRGNAEAWLTSEAFDLKSGRAPDYEALVEKAARLLDQDDPDPAKIWEMNTALAAALDPVADEFLIRWQHICRRKGWIK